MPFIKDEKSGRLYACCDACGYVSRYLRKDEDDVPQGWGGGKDYLRCVRCDNEWLDAWSEQQSAMAYDLR